MKMRTGGRPVLGLFAGASTGVFWGVPFLVPQVLPGYSAGEIAFGRFFFFGLMGVVFVQKALEILKRLSPRERFQVFLLSACGFWLYSTILFWSIRRTNGILSSLILGMLPVTIPLFTPGRKGGGVGFYFGLLLIAGGLALLFAPGGNRGAVVAVEGVIGLFVCLGMWTWFSIQNSRFLQARPHISRRDFSSLMGLISLVSLMGVLLPTLLKAQWAERESISLYLGFSAVLGVGSSWFANWLWNVASVNLPSEVSGTLLVFETIFGVLYTLIYQKRLPEAVELLAIVMCLVGVILAVVFQARSK